MTVAVQTFPEARVQAQAAARWRENRPRAPGRFAEELNAAFALLAQSPEAGRRVKRRGMPGLRRLRLPVTGYHVYYVFQPKPARVSIISIWSAYRGRDPRLRMP